MTWRRQASPRRRRVAAMALVYAVLIGAFVTDLVQRQQRFMHQQQVENALGFGKGIALAGSPAVLAGDVAGAQEMLAAAAGIRELRYGFLVDSEGRVLAHTDRSLIGKYVADPLSLELRSRAAESLVLVDSPDLIDVAVPIFEPGQRLGWVRLGIGQESTRRALFDIAAHGLGYALVAVVLAVAAAAWVGRRAKEQSGETA